jgi:hypothetical protein
LGGGRGDPDALKVLKDQHKDTKKSEQSPKATAKA